MRKLLLLSFCIICFQTAFSQSSRLFAAYYYNPSEDLIIKAYNSTQFISSSFCRYSGFSFISLRETTGDIKFKLIYNCKINDFVISNDTVFFCGHSPSGKGVIGFLDINDFFYNNGGYHIQDIFNMVDGYYAADLKKLVTYFDYHNVRHVFAIGYTSHDDYPTDNFGCVVDLINADDDYAIYLSAYVFKTDSNLFQDIALTDNHIVTSGFDFSGYLNARVFKRNNPFALNGIQNNIVEITGPSTSSLLCWNTNESEVSSSSEGFFSLSSIYRIKFGSIYSNWNVFLAKLSLADVINQSTGAVYLSRYMHCSGYNTPIKIHEFMYNRTKDRYSILFRNQLSVRDIFVEIKPNIDGLLFAFRDYDLNYGVHDIFRLSSYDIFNNGNYVYFGEYPEETWDKYYQFETSGLQSLCAPSVECSFGDVSVKLEYMESKLLFLRDSSNIRQVDVPIVHEEQLERICYH